METKDVIIDILVQIERLAQTNKVWGGTSGYQLLGVNPLRQGQIIKLARQGINILDEKPTNQYKKEAQHTEQAVKDILPGIDCCE